VEFRFWVLLGTCGIWVCYNILSWLGVFDVGVVAGFRFCGLAWCFIVLCFGVFCNFGICDVFYGVCVRIVFTVLRGFDLFVAGLALFYFGNFGGVGCYLVAFVVYFVVCFGMVYFAGFVLFGFVNTLVWCLFCVLSLCVFVILLF